MDFMRIHEIYDECAVMLAGHQDRGTTVSLFRALYPYPLDDRGSIFSAIGRCDLHTSRSLEEKISRAMMDSSRLPETQGEALMFRLRVENAVRILAILAQSKVPCEVCTGIREEGVLWALTTLWKVGRGLWIDHTAAAFLQGLSSALDSPPDFRPA